MAPAILPAFSITVGAAAATIGSVIAAVIGSVATTADSFSSAADSSFALPIRCSRSLRKHRSINNASPGVIDGLAARGGSGSSRTMRVIVSVTVSPRNGSFPVAASYRTIPSEKRSVRASSGLPSACSGDM